jgi:cardiolipin synthase
VVRTVQLYVPTVAEYRIKDLVLVPNLVSGARVPLAFAFPLAASNAYLALGVLGFAGLSDVVDGWAARKLGQATPVGALVDGVADKVFAASVLGTLVATRMLSPVAALLLATRELAELPLAIRVLTSKRARLTEIDRKANRFGKIATVLEFTTVLAVIVRAPGKRVLLAATAVVGAIAAASYWAREIRAVQAEEARDPSGPLRPVHAAGRTPAGSAERA